MTTAIDRSHPLLVIIGPSGAGKSMLVRKLEEQKIVELTKSWTTRPKRADEQEYSEHIHVSENEFSQKVKEGFFLKDTQLFGLPYRYGLPRVTLSNMLSVPCIMLRAEVTPLLAKFYDIYKIYQIEAPLDVAQKRLEQRGDSPKEISHRLDSFTSEVMNGRAIANRVFGEANFNNMFKAVVKAMGEDF